MIVTVTPNPSLDRTIEVERLLRGGVVRAVGGRVDPGGKGINVARALAAHGVATSAVLPCGGTDGLHLTRLLESYPGSVRAVPIDGSIRTNVTIVEPDGTTTKFNEIGPTLSVDEVEALVAATVELVVPGGWVVGCGSLPPGVAVGFFADLIAAVHDRGARIAVDTSGPALRAAIAEGPDLIKPNREELVEASGVPVGTVGDAVRAARVLCDLGAATVLASLGADGAVLVDPVEAILGTARIDAPRSTVGAGDAALAGFLSCPAGGRAAFATALAWGAAAASLPGSRMPGPAATAAVRTAILQDHFDRGQPLGGDT